jgi:hypothetical protein
VLWCEGVVGLEMASGTCGRSGLEAARTGSEKTRDDEREAQKAGSCRSTGMDGGWGDGFMQHTRVETGEHEVESGLQ